MFLTLKVYASTVSGGSFAGWASGDVDATVQKTDRRIIAFRHVVVLSLLEIPRRAGLYRVVCRQRGNTRAFHTVDEVIDSAAKPAEHDSLIAGIRSGRAVKGGNTERQLLCTVRQRTPAESRGDVLQVFHGRRLSGCSRVIVAGLGFVEVDAEPHHLIRILAGTAINDYRQHGGRLRLFGKGFPDCLVEVRDFLGSFGL